ncbi:testis-specific Y-encoded protein 3-like [Ovis canadensis]|uniref:testis-specific Y-encoded protein 3-like n=1 Tax=Ovis canadensis TaxID=37174 RepID=UPI0037529EDB
MEEVEVVVYEEQEQVSLEEQGQEHPRPRAASDQPALEALVALKLELDPMSKKAQRVEEFRHPTHHCKITLSFQRNRYFQNEMITKEYLINVTGY